MDFDTLESTKERLANWQRAFRNNIHYRVTASLEGSYKCPQCWEEKQVNSIVDTIDALTVERAVIRLPKVNKAIVKYNYFENYKNLQGWCRKNQIRIDQFESELQRSICMIHNLLHKPVA